MKFETLNFLDSLVADGEFDTLGDLSELFKLMKSNGWTRSSAYYVLDKVWWDE